MDGRPPDDVLLGEAPIRPVIGRRDRFVRLSLAGADVTATLLTLTLTAVLLGDGLASMFFVVFAPAVVVAAKVQGLYDRDELLLRRTTLDEVPQLFGLATLVTLLISLTPPSLVATDLQREAVLLLWPWLFVMLVAGRASARAATLRILPPERCLLVGDGETADVIERGLRQGTGTRALVVGRLSLERVVHGRIDDVERAVGTLGAHRVILVPRATDSDEVLDAVKRVKGLGIKVTLVPRMLEVVGSSVVFDEVDGLRLLSVRRFGLTRSSRAIKRMVDLVGAAIGLIALGPVMLAISLAIKLDGPGPVLFRQTRVGRDGKRFYMLKFRTMVPDAESQKAALRGRNEAHGLFKIADDPRITSVGRVLRRTSLDELPQLLNVWKGDMSLVGPRPLVVEEDQQIRGLARRRLHLTPGMTGPWQILGSARIPLHEMVKIDYLYVANWTLWADVKILLRTMTHMLRRGGL